VSGVSSSVSGVLFILLSDIPRHGSIRPSSCSCSSPNGKRSGARGSPAPRMNVLAFARKATASFTKAGAKTAEERHQECLEAERKLQEAKAKRRQDAVTLVKKRNERLTETSRPAPSVPGLVAEGSSVDAVTDSALSSRTTQRSSSARSALALAAPQATPEQANSTENEHQAASRTEDGKTKAPDKLSRTTSVKAAPQATAPNKLSRTFSVKAAPQANDAPWWHKEKCEKELKQAEAKAKRRQEALALVMKRNARLQHTTSFTTPRPPLATARSLPSMRSFRNLNEVVLLLSHLPPHACRGVHAFATASKASGYVCVPDMCMLCFLQTSQATQDLAEKQVNLAPCYILLHTIRMLMYPKRRNNMSRSSTTWIR